MLFRSDVIADGIAASLEELLQAARGKQARTKGAPGSKATPQPKDFPDSNARSSNGGPRPILPTGRTRPSRGPAADMRAKRERGSRPVRKPRS